MLARAAKKDWRWLTNGARVLHGMVATYTVILVALVVIEKVDELGAYLFELTEHLPSVMSHTVGILLVYWMMTLGWRLMTRLRDFGRKEPDEEAPVDREEVRRLVAKYLRDGPKA